MSSFLPPSRTRGTRLEATMFALLIGVGALFLAVFVSAILATRSA
jgi:hypothetical protein